MNITEVISYTLSQPTGRRKDELSFCNVLFCVLVLFIHTVAEPISVLNRSDYVYFLAIGPWRLSSFVVQGFLFLSGLKLFLPEKKEERILSFYKKRLIRVVFPYICAFLLFALYFFLTGIQSLTPLTLLRDFFTGNLCGHFYFVIIICQFYLLFPLWKRMLQRGWMVPGLILALFVTVMSKLYLPGIFTLLTEKPFVYDNIVFTNYLFYFIAGAWCGTVYERFRIYLTDRRRSVFITWAILGGINWIFIYLNARGIYYAPWLELFHMLYCLYAILGCLSIGQLLSGCKLFQKPFFKSWDKWSYHVYLSHPLVIFGADSLMNRAGLSSLGLRFLLRAILVCVFMSLFVYLCQKLSLLKKKK